MIHAYYGEGKGKTSAAMGLALRALGHDRRVIIVQFLKGSLSGEVKMLAQLPGTTVLTGKPGLPFVWNMSQAEKAETRAYHMRQFEQVRRLTEAGACDVLVLDEVFGALETGLLDENALTALLDAAPEVEIVLTGRVLPGEIRKRADYITRMEGERHPFEKGVKARAGVEY